VLSAHDMTESKSRRLACTDPMNVLLKNYFTFSNICGSSDDTFDYLQTLPRIYNNNNSVKDILSLISNAA